MILHYLPNNVMIVNKEMLARSLTKLENFLSQCTMSILHLDTTNRTPTLHVSNLINAEKGLTQKTMCNTNELVEYSLVKSGYADCIAQDACHEHFNLDFASHECSFMFYFSLLMVKGDAFACNKFD